MVKIKPSTRNDFINVYGTPLNKTFKAVTVFLDGKAVGIGGIYYSNTGNTFTFAHVKPELKPYKLAIYKAAMKVKEIITKEEGPVYAVADKTIPRSDELLLKMGFIYTAPTSRGGLYEWIG